MSRVGTFGGDCSGCARSGGQAVPAGPGRFALPLRLRRTVHGHGAGSGRVQPPDTGQPRERVCEHSTRIRAVTETGLAASSPAVASALPRCGRAAGRLAQTWPLARSGRAARRSGTCPHPSFTRAAAATGGSPCSPPICHGPGLTQGWLCGLPGVRSNSTATSCGSAGVQPAPGCRTRRFRCVCDGRDRLVRVRARCWSGGSSLSAASLWPYATPFTTVYPPAVPPRRRGRCRCVCRRTGVGEAPTRGDRLGIWR